MIRRAVLLAVVFPAAALVALSPTFPQSQSGVLSSSPSSFVGSVQAPKGPLSAVNRPIPLVDVVEDSADSTKTTFVLTAQAKAIFRQLTGPVYVVTLHGHVRTGKSTLLSFFVRQW